MARPEDSAWAIPVAKVASRAGQSKTIDAIFPAPSGIGDGIVGIAEGSDIHVAGTIDSIVDGLVFTGKITAPLYAECTRCLTDIKRDLSVDVTTFFPYDERVSAGKDHGHKNEEVDIIAGEDESEDTYPLSRDGGFADIEALLRDTLVEALPLQALCKEDCLGLCPQCGINLNENPEHQHNIADIRFAGLEQLKAKLEEENTKH